MNLTEERITILTEAAKGREREIMHYQINIDNYERAITEIETNYTDPEILAFAEQLKNLLASSKLEQTKEQIMLKVIKEQLECMSD